MAQTSSRITNPGSGDIIDFKIDSLSYHGGRGVGRHEGVVVFIGGVAPGERVRARVTVKKPRFWEAELIEILEASPARREPPCPVAGKCGGCAWQHVTYPIQVEQKEKILRDSLRALSKYGAFEWKPLRQAPAEFGYRNRIQVHVDSQGRVGFFSSRSRDLVPTRTCLIAESKVNEALAILQSEGASRIEIALLEGGEVRLMPGARDPDAAVFSQVNRAQNEALKEMLLALAAEEPNWIMDLYAGSGNLTASLSQAFPTAELMAAELSRAAVERGRVVLPGVIWKTGDVERVLAQQKRRPGRGLVVLDPPRTGASQRVTDELQRLSPQQILYVSCNPTTFARDAERLVRTGRYRITSVQGLDMFPQTEHVELVASLCAAT